MADSLSDKDLERALRRSARRVDTAAARLHAAIEERDRWVMQARAQGWSLRRIAHAAGLSPQGALMAIRRGGEAEP